jgi:photosystem II stability/assembly factor-like uncharacterized protein
MAGERGRADSSAYHDGGITWSRLPNPPIPYGLNAIFFLDANTGWAVSIHQIILRTDNGGTSWTVQLSLPLTPPLFSIAFLDANRGIAVGGGLFGPPFRQGQLVLTTTNGGNTWFERQGVTTNTLYGLSFFDANTAVAVGEAGTILRTTNRGASQRRYLPLPALAAPG